jgi:chromosome segregation ATPase
MSHYEHELRSVEDKIDVLDDCSKQADKKIQAFHDRMNAQRKKVKSLDGIVQQVKMAASYSRMINSFMTGPEYNAVLRGIEEMKNNIAKAKNQALRDMDETRHALNTLRRTLERLENELAALRREEGRLHLLPVVV